MQLFSIFSLILSISFMLQKSTTAWTLHNAQGANNIGQDQVVRNVRLGGRDLTVTYVTLTLDLPAYVIV